MPERVQLQFRYTEKEFVAATRLYLSRQPALLFRLSAGFILLSLGIFFLGVVGAFPTLLILAGVGAIFLALALSIFFVLPRQRFRSDPKYRDEYFLEFAEDGIHFQTPHVNATLDWSLYTKVYENESFYVLEYGKGMISVLPKRALLGAHQEALLKDMLRRKLGYDGRQTSQLKEMEASDGSSSSPVAYVPPPEPPDWR